MICEESLRLNSFDVHIAMPKSAGRVSKPWSPVKGIPRSDAAIPSWSTGSE